MVFCGQCGFQLAPGILRCPRCGATTEVDSSGATIENLPVDGPTVASKRVTQNPSRSTYGPNTSDYNPQPLILRDNAGATYNNTQGTYGATAGGVPPSYNPYQTQAAGDYTQPPATPYATPSTPPYPQTYVPAEKPIQHNGGGRVTGLVLILLGLLLILGSLGFFAYQHRILPWLSHSSATPTIVVTTITLTPVQHAKQLLNQYYTNLNHHQYRIAYNRWKNIQQSYAAYVQGYKYTVHDTLIINNAVEQSDGTVRLDVTLQADENPPSGLQHSIFQGYYIVGQYNGQWLIFNGQLNKA